MLLPFRQISFIRFSLLPLLLLLTLLPPLLSFARLSRLHYSLKESSLI